ncbi:cell division regulator GpsB [Leuconostoc citreum]|uniref:Cell cycle protein GpsB n=1 Tax=Leuconostoc citreum TaxID=33964 RepID=A0A5A5TYW5_LEUCI|nr:cell division regulator GpsB [Leuconostoc citreum]KAF0261504.1 cell division regulator GpsB [Leuconostoc citreum]MBA5937442.1 cell division regulator GpsB [Leuconostoc citreum]MBE4725094.1 cell division regulator GpsB [Leuconostoc citreum]MCS8596039.1 cell division regulator GpsB [Leuconostoc citreum]MCT3054124.1 cell division regulator GpsB [Leuconostoc citreum]
MEQVKYTQKDILERVFKQKRMGVGYDPADVDSFLDDIIKDYGAFAGRIEQLQGEVARLQTALKASQDQLVAIKQQQTNVAAEPVVEAPVTPVVETPKAAQVVTNLDLIKRVANLERAVFGHDSDNV